MAVGDPYITREQLKSVLGITNDDENDLIDRAVRGASRSIERRTGFTTFWNTGAVETRAISTDRRIVPNRNRGTYRLLLPDAIASATGLVVSGGTLVNPGRTGDPYTEVTFTSLPAETINITAVWGWPEVPDDIVMATQFQAQRYYKRRGSPEGLAGSAEWGTVTIPRLDPDVASILIGGGYMNPGIG